MWWAELLFGGNGRTLWGRRGCGDRHIPALKTVPGLAAYGKSIAIVMFKQLRGDFQSVYKRKSLMTTATVEQALVEAILQEIEEEKVDALALLRLQMQCSQIKTFPAFCNGLTIEQWSETMRAEMLQWQTALGLSSEKMYLVMNLPVTKFTTALQTQNLHRILDAAEAIKALS